MTNENISKERKGMALHRYATLRMAQTFSERTSFDEEAGIFSFKR